MGRGLRGRVIGVVCLAVVAAAPLAGCDKGKSESEAAEKSGPSVDKVDLAALEAGQSKTVSLKFWTTERGLVGDDLVPVLHFDDGDNQRIVLTYDDALAEQAKGLEQGKVYQVTFEANGKDELIRGKTVSVE